MRLPDALKQLAHNPEETQRRLQYFELRGEDLEQLKALRAFALNHTQDVIGAFYAHLLEHDGTAAHLGEPGRLERLKKTQQTYFAQLFDGVIDEAYIEGRLRVGYAHHRIGLAPKWYIGAYAKYLRVVFAHLAKDAGLDAKAVAGFSSLTKLVMFDMSLAIDTYIASHLEAIRRHEAAIRELSTPVIQVHDGVLLLPIVGTIDSHRAQQIMEAVLSGVSKHQAPVMILDIAGVPVVDTQVADHLLKTTAAVKLLGARTILTGISPQVARTIVELGVDISTMETCNQLADGIERALALVGRRIAPIAPQTPGAPAADEAS